jgi:hypothetical protein
MVSHTGRDRTAAANSSRGFAFTPARLHRNPQAPRFDEKDEADAPSGAAAPRAKR